MPSWEKQVHIVLEASVARTFSNLGIKDTSLFPHKGSLPNWDATLRPKNVGLESEALISDLLHSYVASNKLPVFGFPGSEMDTIIPDLSTA